MNVIIDGISYFPKVNIELMPMSFGDFIRTCRQQIGLTLDDASKTIGCSKSRLWELENNESDFTFRLACGISMAYGVELVTLAAYLSPQPPIFESHLLDTKP